MICKLYTHRLLKNIVAYFLRFCGLFSSFSLDLLFPFSQFFLSCSSWRHAQQFLVRLGAYLKCESWGSTFKSSDLQSWPWAPLAHLLLEWTAIFQFQLLLSDWPARLHSESLSVALESPVLLPLTHPVASLSFFPQRYGDSASLLPNHLYFGIQKETSSSNCAVDVVHGFWF